MGWTGIEAEIAKLRKAVADLEQQAVTEVKRAAFSAVNTMMNITPVNTGETLRNYAVGINAPNRTYHPPLGQQPPAPTNKLGAPGTEPNRGANQAAAMGEISQALSFKKLATVYITNNVASDKWELIESGNAPGAPFINRGPGGQSALATAGVRNGSGGLWK